MLLCNLTLRILTYLRRHPDHYPVYKRRCDAAKIAPHPRAMPDERTDSQYVSPAHFSIWSLISLQPADNFRWRRRGCCQTTGFHGRRPAGLYQRNDNYPRFGESEALTTVIHRLNIFSHLQLWNDLASAASCSMCGRI